jgi:hypothetical protein
MWITSILCAAYIVIMQVFAMILHLFTLPTYIFTFWCLSDCVIGELLWVLIHSSCYIGLPFLILFISFGPVNTSYSPVYLSFVWDVLGKFRTSFGFRCLYRMGQLLCFSWSQNWLRSFAAVLFTSLLAQFLPLWLCCIHGHFRWKIHAQEIDYDWMIKVVPVLFLIEHYTMKAY